jgi:hypothetical protein
VSEPISVVPPRKNCTCEIVPSESAALAVRAMVEPGTKFAPFAGAVRLTVGSVLTRIVLAADVAVAPVLSVAFAVRL